MKVRFQTYADFDRRIVRATLRREPAIDLQLATEARGGAGLRGIPDTQVLAVAAQEGRMLLPYDHHTMPRHFGDFITSQASPGVIIMPQRMLISVAVEWIMTIWLRVRLKSGSIKSSSCRANLRPGRLLATARSCAAAAIGGDDGDDLLAAPDGGGAGAGGGEER